MRDIIMISSVHPITDTRIYEKEAVSLAESGFSVHLYGIAEGGAASPVENLTLHPLRKRARTSRILTVFHLSKEIGKYNHPIVHLHDPELLLLPVLRRFNKNVTFIYDMHEHFPSTIRTKEWLPALIRRPLSWLCARGEKAAMRRCEAVLFAESYYSSYYRETSAEPLTILNYPLNRKRQTKKVYKGRSIRLVYAGAVSTGRGFKEMLFLAKRLKEEQIPFTLDIVGRVPQELAVWGGGFLSFHQLQEKVQLHGRLPFREVDQIYQKSDIGLCLLHPEENYVQSMATKIYEYMQYSLPVLASNFPKWKELIAEAECGFTGDPFDTEWIVGAVKQLHADREQLHRLGENGVRMCRRHYQWDTQADKLIGLYDRLMKEEGYESPVSSSAL
ncbi:glycosyltransferase [Halobacillus halophilus]|uniref:glycosyltransferase n=1 Tax=Halobacillus halophilus TaxID=1570 RepID=UPI00136D11AC|nr:glycosyltransferase [Halobacillus halophilus]MYL30806.1 glycosyltransferase [Halobacillus halophilus]